MKKRILACLLALVMLIGLLPVTALAVDAGGTTVPMLDVSKSKTATALDASGQTQITLSLPSAEMKKTLDVVFVVDNAFPKENQDAAQKAAELLEQLSAIGTGGNLTINVGLVISGGYIPVLKEISLADITNALRLKMQLLIQIGRMRKDAREAIFRLALKRHVRCWMRIRMSARATST